VDTLYIGTYTNRLLFGKAVKEGTLFIDLSCGVEDLAKRSVLKRGR
jgi:hypothetical protein